MIRPATIGSPMDMSKYKALFLSDTTEHLDVLEQNLVELESSFGRMELIHEVFRHLHSIKGMASSMGYSRMMQLAHKLEDLIDIHRERKTPLCDEEFDLLLDGLDTLRKQLVDIEENRELSDPGADLLERIQNAMLKLNASTEPAGIEKDAHSTVESKNSKPEEHENGLLEYRLRAVIPPDCDAPALRAFLAVKRLSEIGEISDAVPNLAELLAGRFEGEFIQLNLVTDRSLDAVRNRLDTLSGLDSWTVRLIDPRTEQMPAASSSAISLSDQANPSSARGAKTRQVDTGTVRIGSELLDFFVDSVGELITLRSYFQDVAVPMDSPALNEGIRRLNQVVRKLQDRVMEVRMVPISLLTQRIPRVCRDLAQKQGKQIQVQVKGADVKLDRNMVESLDVPVLHILRNAIDHGIESPAQRERSGKNPQGRIELDMKRESDRIIMTICDDGKGIDEKEILRHARKNLPDHWIEKKIQENNVLDLIFEPGFSTRDVVSDVSGRGVGLDAVRNTLRTMEGHVRVTSNPGAGSCFILDLPLTLAIVHVLLVEIENYLLALPASRVLQVAKPDMSRMRLSSDENWVQFGGTWHPLKDLLSLMKRQSAKEFTRHDSEIVLIGEADKPIAALAIGHISGHREIVMKNVGPIIRKIGPFSGSAVLGDGRPVLVVDLDEVLRRVKVANKGMLT